jgi:hypothetical protein
MQIEPVFNIRIHWFENIEWFHTDESIMNREQMRAFTTEHSPHSNPPLARCNYEIPILSLILIVMHFKSGSITLQHDDLNILRPSDHVETFSFF